MQATLPGGLIGVVQVVADFHSLAVKNDGTVVVAWGDNSYSKSSAPSGLSSVVQVAIAEHAVLIYSNKVNLDDDGLTDSLDINILDTNPSKVDSDGDGCVLCGNESKATYIERRIIKYALTPNLF